MYRYVIKRLLFLIPTVLGVTLIIFFVMGITPGNPGRMILGPTAKQEAVDAKNHELGYDLPLWQRYVNYVKDIVTEGDFGNSYFTSRPVFEELWPRFLLTLKLASFILIVSVGMGIPLGIYSAVRQYTPFLQSSASADTGETSLAQPHSNSSSGRNLSSFTGVPPSTGV